MYMCVLKPAEPEKHRVLEDRDISGMNIFSTAIYIWFGLLIINVLQAEIEQTVSDQHEFLLLCSPVIIVYFTQEDMMGDIIL